MNPIKSLINPMFNAFNAYKCTWIYNGIVFNHEKLRMKSH